MNKLGRETIGEDMGMNSTIKLPTLNPDGTSVETLIYFTAALTLVRLYIFPWSKK